MTRTFHRALCRACALAAVLGAGAAAAGDAAKPPLALEDVFSLQYADAPIVGPAGEYIYYLRVSMDIMSDQRRRNLWRVRSDGSGHRPLTTGARSVSSPALSPRGDRIAYVDRDDVGSQIFVQWLDDGRVAQLTRGAETPSRLSWSPDGKWLAYTMRVPFEAPTMGKLPKAPEGAEWAPAPKVIDRVVYRNDGAGERPEAYYQIFLLSAEGGAARQLTSEPFDHSGGLDWTPDSSSIVFSARREDDWALNVRNSNLYRIDITSAAVTRITERQGTESDPAVSPDGRWIAFTGADDRGLPHHNSRLYLVGIDGQGMREVLPELDRDIADPQWSEDGSHIYFRFDDEGDTVLARTTVGGNMTRLAQGLGGTSLGRPYAGANFDIGGGDRYAFTAGGLSRPADIATGIDGGATRRLTGLSDTLLANRSLATVEEFWVESSADDERIQAWLALPPGFDPGRRYPLILEIHGGPHTNYGRRFSAEVQLYAAAGYVVLYVNPRGSTSYGERFANLIQNDYPGLDYDDLMTAVDTVIERGFIDEDALYVTGGSGGGVLTAWIVGRTDRFRAAVVAKPVINWTSFALTADNAPYFTRYWFPAMPWEDPQHYWQRSPLSLVGNVSTPTMLLTGEADLRTPIAETEQYYQALKLRGVETAMVRMPGASHSIARRPSQLMGKVAAILEWFERHPPPGKTPRTAQQGGVGL
jgi:acylaminoacyl-peptidase